MMLMSISRDYSQLLITSHSDTSKSDHPYIEGCPDEERFIFAAFEDFIRVCFCC